MNNKTKEIFKGLLGLILYFIGMFTIIITISSMSFNNMSQERNIGLIINVIVFIIVLILDVIIFRKELKKDFLAFFGSKRSYYFKWTMFAFVLSFIFAIIANIITGLIGGGKSTNENIVESSLGSLPAIMIIYTIILAPILEEITFRLSIFKLIPFKPIAGIVSVILFGAIHVFLAGDYINIIPYIAMGGVLVFVYWKTSNIFTSIGIHMARNALTTIVILFMLLPK